VVPVVPDLRRLVREQLRVPEGHRKLSALPLQQQFEKVGRRSGVAIYAPSAGGLEPPHDDDDDAAAQEPAVEAEDE
jgi:hypothetical protein